MKILLVSATPFELAPLLSYLESTWDRTSFFDFEKESKKITTLVTGVGMINSGLAIARYNKISEVDLLLNVGIAGSFSEDISIGAVVEVVKDRYGDFGVEEGNGNRLDAFDMGWEDPNGYPHSNGWLVNDSKKYDTNLPKVNGVTVNCVSGTAESIAHLINKYGMHVESMEGAVIHQLGLINKMNFRQIRSISNKVEKRDKSSWKIEEAIDNLNNVVIDLIERW